jgi:signal peptidase I
MTGPPRTGQKQPVTHSADPTPTDTTTGPPGGSPPALLPEMNGSQPLLRRSMFRGFGRLGIFAIALGFALPAIMAGPYVVEHTSMEPTLEPGEIMLVDRMTPRIAGYGRGDLVVFQPPGGAGLFVKRIVGLPGEEVILARSGIFVDGKLVAEPYLCGERPSSRPHVMEIPDGMYLVLGDNRSASLDSRSFGPVPSDMMVGRVWAGYRLDAGELALFTPGLANSERGCH